jgi:hypothetical protein
MGTPVNKKRFWNVLAWHIASNLNRLEWRHTAALGLICLWATLIGTIDYPLYLETRHMALQRAMHLALKPVHLRPAIPQSAPSDPTSDFVTVLPEFPKYPEQLRMLNLLADRSAVVITRTEYRYEQMPALPIKKLTLRMELSGGEVQQRRFLVAALNTLPNLSVARLAYAKSTEGANKVEQKLDINLYYRSRSQVPA